MSDYAPGASPVLFWDLYGKLGHPVRTTVSEMGPTLLGRVLELNDTQSGVLAAAGGATVIWVDFPAQKAVPLPDWMRALVL